MATSGSFHLPLNQVSNLGVSLDRDGRIEAVNAALCSFLGRTEAQLLGADWFDTAISTEGRDQVRAVFARIMLGQVALVRHYQNRLVRADGNAAPVSWFNLPRRDEHGAIIGTLSLGDPLEAVTDTGSGEPAALRSELDLLRARLDEAQALIDHNPTAVLVLRAAQGQDFLDAPILSVNNAAAALLQLPISQAIGRSTRQAGLRLPWEPLRQAILNAQDPQISTVHLPELHTIEGQDAGVFSVRAFRLGADTVGLTAEDVTQAWRERVESHRQAQFLETVLDHIPDMVFVKEARDLRFVRFNRAGERLLGLSRDELMGRNDNDFFPPDEAEFFIRKDREVLATGGVLEIPEEPIHTRDGVRTLHTKKIGVHDESGRPLYLLGISEDITDRKKAELELERRALLLEQSNRDLEQFAYIASHDLQEPIRKVRQFGDLLAESLGPDLAPEPADFLRRMKLAAERMQGLINDLLTLSRVNSQDRANQPVNLAQRISDLRENLADGIAAIGARVEVGPLPVVLGDQVQLDQLFTNLVCNSLKFHDTSREPVIQVHSRMVSPEMVEISVEDNGIGFPPDEAARIFLPFHRLHGRGDYDGTGMGLAICRRVVERHGGRLIAEGRPGQGATFRVLLPLAPAPK